MSLEAQVCLALALDFLVGDPRWFPHPVRIIGRFAAALEGSCRRRFGNPRTAGIVAAGTVIGAAALATAGLLAGAARLHPLAGDIVAVLLLYTTLAARDLANHSGRVYGALEGGDLVLARQRVSWMVGRDTEGLDEAGVARAAVESVAENTVDGVLAPLLYGVLGGPVGAMAYKAVNTLDSTFGYRNERYARFGWASARIDDGANYLPARLAVPLIAAGAALLAMRPGAAFRMALRDGKKHASPNSGLSEAAMAGALGIQLGGAVHRKGRLDEMPTLGDPLEPLGRRHIRRANALMAVTTVLAAALFIGIRILVTRLM